MIIFITKLTARIYSRNAHNMGVFYSQMRRWSTSFRLYNLQKSITSVIYSSLTSTDRQKWLE